MKETKYTELLRAIESMADDETDPITILSTVSCELFHAFDHVNWAGFYRRVDEQTLKVGPYQGTHGCLTIPIAKGVCGKCVRENTVQIEHDVKSLPHHIACSPDTRAEIVLPLRNSAGNVWAVLDIDSTQPGAFDETDIRFLTQLCSWIDGKIPNA
ncbi:MAG: GAF domain-containing protein [Verrucomicrobiota bacterium]